jgi:ribose/xylose/arabinose/galactoside ABC-type transport system permease subunit
MAASRLDPTMLILRYGMVLVLIGLIIAAVILYPGFLQPANLRNILDQSAAVGIIAVAMTYVLIGGGFDLSVGAVYALSGTVFAGVTLSAGLTAGFVAGLAAGLAAGLVNGLLVARLNVNPFVATLGSASIISGIAFLYSNSAPFTNYEDSFQWLGTATIGGVPLPVLILAIVIAIGWIVLANTRYGRDLYAVGGNREAAFLSGIDVKRITVSTYVLTGATAALAGMITASRLGVGQADVGANVALDAIAIVVVGGTSLLGGEGAVWRSVIGLLILATLTNVFYAVNANQNMQLIAKGSIVIAAVALDAYLRRRETARGG